MPLRAMSSIRGLKDMKEPELPLVEEEGWWSSLCRSPLVQFPLTPNPQPHPIHLSPDLDSNPYYDRYKNKIKSKMPEYKQTLAERKKEREAKTAARKQAEAEKKKKQQTAAGGASLPSRYSQPEVEPGGVSETAPAAFAWPPPPPTDPPHSLPHSLPLPLLCACRCGAGHAQIPWAEQHHEG